MWGGRGRCERARERVRVDKVQGVAEQEWEGVSARERERGEGGRRAFPGSACCLLGRKPRR